MADDTLYWGTALILNGEGANAGVVFTDISPTPKTPASVNGNVQTSTTQVKSGTSSIKFDGTDDYLSYTAHADFDFGSGDGCVELWWRPTAIGAQQSLVFYCDPTTNATNAEVSFGITMQTTGKISGFVGIGLASPYVVNGNVVLVAGTWNHIAFTRESGILKLWINGVQDNSPVAAAGTINTFATRALRFGQYLSGTKLNANGYMSGIRITKGSPRYAVTFTPDPGPYTASAPGTLDADLTGPMGTLVAVAGGSAPLSAPMGTLIALAAGAAHLTAPMGTLEAVGHDSTGERSFAGTAPMGTLQALGGAKATMSAPMGTLIASVSVPISVTAQLVGPMGTVVASGTVGVSMTADLRLSSAGTIEAYAGGQATLEAPMGLLGAIATVGVLAHFAGNAPMGRLVASGTAGIVMRAELTAPMLEPTPSGRATLIAPMGFLTAVGRAVITTTYEAYVVNLQPGERMPHQVTRYDDAWDFDHVIRWRNRYYGVKATGMYLLGADLDGADPIAWTLKTGMSKMGSNQKKTCREGIVYGRVGAGLTGSVTIRGDDTTRKSYDAIVQADEVAEATRIKYGRGIKAVYWSFGLADPDGGPADIDSLQLDAAELSRKVF